MFKKGQTVWCLIYGQGVVSTIRQGGGVGYPFEVLFNKNDDEIVVTYTADGKYHRQGNVTLFPHPVEVVKSATKPSIDWSHVSPKYTYLAQDASGQGYLCSEKPSLVTNVWNMRHPYTVAAAFTSYVPGTCDWKDSLVERPS